MIVLPAAGIAVGDIAAWVLVFVTSVLVVSTIAYTINTRKQVWEMREAREIATAPNVIAYLDVEVNRSLADLVVKNIGKGAARDVMLSFEPPLQTTKDIEIANMNIISEGIPFLPPDQEVRAFFDFLPDYFKSELPDQYSATVTFEGGITKARRTNLCIIDFSVYRNLSNVREKTLHDLVVQAEKLTGEIEKMRKALVEHKRAST